MKSKKIIAGLLALTFVFGGTVSNCAPVISQCITAQAAREVCYTFDENTGVLTLRGEVNNTDIWIANINNRGQIKSVIAEAGTVLPKNCYGLFKDFYCTSIDLSNADTSKVTDMSDMFYGCFQLTDLDVSGFDTSNVTDMSRMFDGCDELSSIDLSSFDTSNVTNMSGMFMGCEKLSMLDLSSFNTSNATKMSDMFYQCESLTSLDLSGFDTSKVRGMSYMFNDCSSLTTLDVSSFDTSNVANMYYMFYGCKSLTTLDISGFDTSKVTNMYYMFGGCTGLTSLDVSNFDTSNVTDINSMFYNCSSLTSLDVSGFDTGNVNNMSYMFENCSSLTSINLGSLDTSMVTTITGMFWGCSGLTKLDLSCFDTSNVTDTNNMFNGCSNLEKLDLSSFDTSKVKYMYNMFAGCEKLNTLTLSENFKNIKEDAVLPNGDGWVNINDHKTVISGNGDYAVIENNGKNTYKLFGTVKLTYPTNIKFEYNQIYHQVRLTWDKVENAKEYGIAIYQAGKWRIQKQGITTTSYTTPRDLTPGKSYKVMIAAKVDGEWDTANAIKHAVIISIPNDTDSDGDGIEDFYEKEENVSSYTIAPIIDSWIDDSESISGNNPTIPDLKNSGMNMRGSTTPVSPEDNNGPRKNELIAIRKRRSGSTDAQFSLTPSKNGDFAFTITGTKETKFGEGYTTDDYESTVKVFYEKGVILTEEEQVEPVEIKPSKNGTEITYVFALEQDKDYKIYINNPTNDHKGEYEIHISEDNWVYAPNGGIKKASEELVTWQNDGYTLQEWFIPSNIMYELMVNQHYIETKKNAENDNKTDKEILKWAYDDLAGNYDNFMEREKGYLITTIDSHHYDETILQALQSLDNATDIDLSTLDLPNDTMTAMGYVLTATDALGISSISFIPTIATIPINIYNYKVESKKEELKDALIDGNLSISVKYEYHKSTTHSNLSFNCWDGNNMINKYAINHRYIQEQTYPGGPTYDHDTGFIEQIRCEVKPFNTYADLVKQPLEEQ